MLSELLNSGRYRLRPYGSHVKSKMLPIRLLPERWRTLRHELRGYNGMLLPLLLPEQKQTVLRELYDELSMLLDKEDDGKTKSLWKKELR